MPFESYVETFVGRGMDSFVGNGPKIDVDTTYVQDVDVAALVEKIRECVANV